MTTDKSDSQIQEHVEKFTNDVEPEVIDVVHQIDAVVDQASVAAEESMDVVAPVVDIVQSLSKGKQAKAIEGALDMLSDETGSEAREAIGALKTLRMGLIGLAKESEDVLGELQGYYEQLGDEIEDFMNDF